MVRPAALAGSTYQEGGDFIHSVIRWGGLSSLPRLPFFLRPGRMRRVKPKPLHRSIIFWSGILVMLFICWAWRDSYFHASSVSFGVGSVVGGNGGVVVFRAESPRFVSYQPSPHLRPDWGLFQTPFFLRGQGYEAVLEERELKATRNARELYRLLADSQKRGDWILFIPHWLLLLAFAIAWSGLLLWRGRRYRRADQAVTSAP